jgi:universal stress protein A
MLPIRKLLVPTDFSESSYRGVRAADELALHFSAELIMIHVISPAQFVPPAGPSLPTGQRLPALLEDLMDAARHSIKWVIEEKISDGVSSRSFVLSGAPADEIVRVAAEEEVDAIVISTHGFTGWRRFIFGSVAEKVVRLAECPVLTIPGGEDKK